MICAATGNLPAGTGGCDCWKGEAYVWLRRHPQILVSKEGSTRSLVSCLIGKLKYYSLMLLKKWIRD